ncbi:hypothetical protein DAEQUDRAFT_712398 [Daedalea quercina L-15889]|uniref:Lytic polysaccharide monooxygenase n=1 Tax=Daedalea quercina L-15889 TaxID=1314783 RepID=A0A165PH35_9APHY|nr:hypothetical protein DAEQUDRAFT_712398 [Daedalea quercina L-15889]
MFATSSALSGSAALLLLIVCRLTLAAVTNRTIDDEYGDSVTGRRPIYDGPWNYGPACPGCFVQPSPKDVFMSSWHDTTTSLQNDHQTISLLFNGTAVWVYCVVPNYVQSATTFVNISFNLDGAPVGTYMHQPDESSDVYSYNVTVYSNTDLANTQHTLVMWAVQGSGPSLLLFDWAEYT